MRCIQQGGAVEGYPGINYCTYFYDIGVWMDEGRESEHQHGAHSLLFDHYPLWDNEKKHRTLIGRHREWVSMAIARTDAFMTMTALHEDGMAFAWFFW